MRTEIGATPKPVAKKVTTQNWMSNPLVAGINAMPLTQAIANPISQYSSSSYSPTAFSTPSWMQNPVVAGINAMPLAKAIANPVSQYNPSSYSPVAPKPATPALSWTEYGIGGGNGGGDPQKSAPFQAWYAIPDNAKYWDTINDAEKAALVETLNRYGMTAQPGYSNDAIARASEQYSLQQRHADNFAAMAAKAAQGYYQPTADLGQGSPFSSQYNGWGGDGGGGYGGSGGGGGYANYAPNWLTNLTNWNIA